jgi:hypothetical protein
MSRVLSSCLTDEALLLPFSTVERLKTFPKSSHASLFCYSTISTSVRPTVTSRNFSFSLVLFHLGDVLLCCSLLALVSLLHSLCVFGFLHSSCSQWYCHFLKASGEGRREKKRIFYLLVGR